MSKKQIIFQSVEFRDVLLEDGLVYEGFVIHTNENPICMLIQKDREDHGCVLSEYDEMNQTLIQNDCESQHKLMDDLQDRHLHSIVWGSDTHDGEQTFVELIIRTSLMDTLDFCCVINGFNVGIPWCLIYEYAYPHEEVQDYSVVFYKRIHDHVPSKIALLMNGTIDRQMF